MNTLAIHNQAIIGANQDLFTRWLNFIEGTPKTKETYTRAIRQFIKYLQDNEIAQPTKEDIKAFKEELAINHKPSTVQNYLMAVKQFYKWLEEEQIAPNVAKNVKGVKLDAEHKKDFLTTNQVKTLLASINTDSLKGKRDYSLIALMITTGMRTIEVERANIGDLRALGDFTALYYQGKGRSEKAEYKKVAPQVEKVLREYLTARGNNAEEEPLFTSTANRNNRERLTTRSISRIVKDRLVDAGLDSPRLTAHSLRHTTATQNLLNGGSLEETQLLLGHKSINTTMIYNHTLDRAKSKGEERIATAIFN